MNADIRLEGPRSTEELIGILRQEVELRRQNIRTAKLGSIALVCGLFGLALFAWLIKGTPFLTTLQDFSAFFLVALGGVAMTATHRRALLQVDAPDARLAGFLIEALSYGDPSVVRHAERILVQQLPLLESLAADQSRRLAERLGKSGNVGFVRASLFALRKYGGPECLEFLDALTTPVAGAKRLERDRRIGTGALEASAEIRLRRAREIIEGAEEKVVERG